MPRNMFESHTKSRSTRQSYCSFGGATEPAHRGASMVTMSSNISRTTRHSRLDTVPESTGEENGQPGSPIIRQVEVSVSTLACYLYHCPNYFSKNGLGHQDACTRRSYISFVSHRESTDAGSLQSLTMPRTSSGVLRSKPINALSRASLSSASTYVPHCCSAS